MKYMGSKRSMLRNGLGELLRREAGRANRFFDLFTGSGAVSSFVACKTNCSVQAYDLQQFCASLAEAVIARDEPLAPEPIWEKWEHNAFELLHLTGHYNDAMEPLINENQFTQRFVYDMRARCGGARPFVVTQSYGGYYFSRSQALLIDVLRKTIPPGEGQRGVALAALIRAASHCAAAPGHTAQPFQPTSTAKKFLYESWNHNILTQTKSALAQICGDHAKVAGIAKVADANEAVKSVEEKDLVFIDPPYSGVHYSRFYHVLETIARGECGVVSGVGRYPPAHERPRSKYSVGTESREAISQLLQNVAERGATAIVTFPDKKCSNGVSSYLLEKIAKRHFRKVTSKTVRGRFSTMGGDGQHRQARQFSAELVILMKP